jgi:phenylacetate-CoA ligase
MASRFDTIYSRLPVSLQNAAISLYGMKLRKLRYGGSYPQIAKEVAESQHLDAHQMRKLMETRLRALLQNAFVHVPYYRNLARENGINYQDADLTSFAQLIPTLSKQVVRNAPEGFVSTAIPPDQLTYINTSGSSGSPLPVATTRTAIQRNYAFFARYLAWHGVDPKDHGVTFAGRLLVPMSQAKPPFWRYNRAMDTLLCSSYHLSEEWLGEYVRAIAEFRPKFIDSYPSALATLATYMNRNGLAQKIRPKVIITSSETLLDSQREEIERAFGCPIRDHYGCAEMAALITQCERGTYHVNPDFGIVEILREDGTPCEIGEVGDICCTGFVNGAMPLIRYLIGDRAETIANNCACGRAFPAIGRLHGRMDDVIVTPDGRQVGRLDPAFKGGSGIREAQIVQTHIDRIRVLVVPDAAFTKDVAESLKKELQRRLSEDMQITIETVAAIPRQRNGKFRSVVSLLKTAQKSEESA